MSNILKNTWKLFSRHKEYASTIIVTPIMMLLIFSFILSFQSKVNIAVIDKSGDGFGAYMKEILEDTDLIKILDLEESSIETNIQAGKIEFAVMIEDSESKSPVTVIKSKDSSVATYMEYILKGAVAKYKNEEVGNLLQNEVEEKGVPIGNAMGMVIFKMLAAASLLAELMIIEKKRGIIQRIFISKTNLATYLLGRGLVFFIHMLIYIACYFLTAFLFHFDFEMRNPIRMAVIFMVMGVFTTTFGMFLGAVLKDEGAVWNVGVLVLLPTSILSGAMFPFESMPKLLKIVGSFFPQRWIASAVEILQNGGSLMDTVKPLGAVLLASLCMFAFACMKLGKRKRVKI
ncbi:MAG: ABC transporter permease [Lachnospiraceae bacterium]|nr:ABC transporter permease [Lachnospiraceae bacterium]